MTDQRVYMNLLILYQPFQLLIQKFSSWIPLRALQQLFFFIFSQIT